ncbi:MAG: hypothetical protein D6793_00960 [Thermoflexia bacterium]|nr:MAG: hypothetical protein D6793_00960 [Thermoflexia bacterium]
MPGFPTSFETGIGIRIPWGSRIPAQASRNYNWVQIEVPWAELQPVPGRPPSWERLDPLIQQAAQQGLCVLISLQQAPSWARTTNGPQVEAVQALVQALLQRYPQAFRALELFPAANTHAGWGAPPDPQAYLALYQAVQPLLKRQGVLPVALGLTPLDASSAPDDQDDLSYLEAFYRLPGARQVPVISLRLPHVNADPTAPDRPPQISLRHYERVRALMQAHQHPDGLLWLTNVQSAYTISSWQVQVLQQVSNLLYVGAVFFNTAEPIRPPQNPLPKTWPKSVPKQAIRKTSHAIFPASPTGMAHLAHCRL